MKLLFLDIETVPTEQSLQDNGLLGTEIQPHQAELIKKLSLSATTAKLLCLGYAVEPPTDAPAEILHGDERTILEKFWEMSVHIDLFVGHNILDFDLRFIWQRSIIHAIKPPRDISFARFQQSPIFDTLQEWSKWGREHVSLNNLAKALGIPSPKESLDGSKVYPYYCAGKFADICEYCKRDVETARLVYRRLAFAAQT
jgi:3'-5' exonuclease